ncbi:MAG: hypothetical protein U0575_09835 [Phycisphaerales bacterium]
MSRAKLLGAMKELVVRWNRTRDVWDDAAAEHIERTVIGPLDPRVRATVTAMEKMGQILMKVKKECE